MSTEPKGAPGDPEATPSPTDLPLTPPPGGTPTFEVKDGAMTLDGRKLVFESDLIAAKESLKGRLEEAQTVHNKAIDDTRLELSTAQQQAASANAKLQEATQARESGVASSEEVTRAKQEAEDAKGVVGQATAKALEYRRALLSLQYQIPAEQLQEKDMTQLDSFEEALKALVTSRGGTGPYAIGGTGGGTGPLTAMERATQLLAATPVVGVRNEPPQQ